MKPPDSKKLTFRGASPIVFLLTILFAVPIAVINYLFKPVFRIDFIPCEILIIIAIVLLCLGIPLYIVTLKMLRAAYRKKELITDGIFSICRNPLFAIVIFLLLPGIILFFNSWLLLSIPCFMYFMFVLFIHREEDLMEKEFGQEYIEYKNNTTVIFPAFRRYKKQ
jgi:protein-S-isoprenylcysteine O-methyltransferase Ste14